MRCFTSCKQRVSTAAFNRRKWVRVPHTMLGMPVNKGLPWTGKRPRAVDSQRGYRWSPLSSCCRLMVAVPDLESGEGTPRVSFAGSIPAN